MRTTAQVLGIVGGVFGILAGLLVFAIGGVAAGLDAEGGGQVAVQGFIAILLAIAGIVGGALAQKSPRASWIILLVCGLGGFLVAGWLWVLSGLLFVVAAIFEFVGRKEKESVPVAAG